jgi:hypothetical protein
MATHPDLHRELAGYVLRVLDAGEARAFAVHPTGCRHCLEQVDELGGLPVLPATGAAVEVAGATASRPAGAQPRPIRLSRSPACRGRRGGRSRLRRRRRAAVLRRRRFCSSLARTPRGLDERDL